MLCEMCGSEVPHTKLVMIEGAAMNVCQKCEKFASSGAVKTKNGEIVMPAVAQRLDKRERRKRQRDIYDGNEGLELALDYPERVRSRRHSLGMSQEDLAKSINEKKSVIVKVEAGDMRPDDRLLTKLERALRTSLREKVDAISTIEKKAYSQGMTLGDFIRYED
jgi:putative transcription factor